MGIDFQEHKFLVAAIFFSSPGRPRQVVQPKYSSKPIEDKKDIFEKKLPRLVPTGETKISIYNIHLCKIECEIFDRK